MNGTSRESSSKRSSGRSMPSRPAIAGRWMTAFVEPPSACSVAMALWNAAGVRICESRRSSCTICTMRRPVMWASARRRESAAGIAAAPGQRRAERLGHRRHRAGGAHRVAVAVGARVAGLDLEVLRVGDLAAPAHVGDAPEIGARADLLVAPLAVQHRPAGHADGRQVDARGAHQLRRRRLVAAAQQHDAVERVGAQRLLDVHRHEVAPEHRGRLHHRLAERDRRELERQAAGLPDAALDVLGDDRAGARCRS